LKDETMKTDILIILAVTLSNLGAVVTAAAKQTDESLPDRPTSQHSKPVVMNHDPNSDYLAISDTGATWGLHEQIKNCVSCHGNESEQNPPDELNLVAPVPKLCYICHKEHVKPGGWVHGPAAAGECLLCHNPHKANNKSLLNKPIPELCYNCHELKTLRLVANHSDESYAHCNVCHAGHASESRMLLKNCFLNADEGLVYISKDPSALPRPMFVDSRSSLSGLQGVEVVPVIEGSELLGRYGVTEDSVRTEVEQQLQQNGIKILRREEQTARKSSLHVYLRLMELPSFRHSGQVDALSGSFNIFLQQTVELLPAPGDAKRRYCTATTWDTGAILIWGKSQVDEGLREAVEVLVGRFSKDYLAANPKAGISVSVNGE
jgi:predicted CXXCH cytochrome family protein